MNNFAKIFQPKSVALIGASNKPKSIGNSLMLNLQSNFTGKIYPINLKEKKVSGLKAYASLSDVKEAVDLMIIAVPAKIVPQILNEGGSLGIKGAIIISAGFKEIGNIELEEELKAICKKYQITLIGPNCLGVLNPHFGLNASFAAYNATLGDIAFISQSGAICTAILDSATKLGLGFSKFISVGNKAMVDEVALFDYLAQDKQTKVIAVYAEHLNNPELFIKAIKKLRAVSKPVIILKAGRSQAGAKASASHTGALAGEDIIYQALFNQAGVIRAEKVDDLFDYLKIFKNNNLGPAKKIAIITNAGGPGVIAVDILSSIDLELATLSKKTVLELKKVLPVAASTNNPVDILGDAGSDRYESALNLVLKDSLVQAALVILSPQATTDINASAEAIIRAKKKFKKPIAAVFMGNEMVSQAIKKLTDNLVAVYSFPESGIKALKALNDFDTLTKEKIDKRKVDLGKIDKQKVKDIFFQAQKEGRKNFSEITALEILQAYNFPTLKSYLAKTKEEAMMIAKKIAKPLVLKISSDDILHKTDVGGIMLNVMPAEAADKFTEMIKAVKKNKPQAKIDGILMVEMQQNNGQEMILGSFRDNALGQTIMLGLGGVYVEVFKDVSFAFNPLSRKEAIAMISRLKANKLLSGFRGSLARDKEALIENILRLAKLVSDFPEIKELDINPLLVLNKGEGIKVLDARIVID